MLVRQLIHKLEQFEPEESIEVHDYDKDEDFDIVEIRREKGYNVIRIRSIPTYNFSNVIVPRSLPSIVLTETVFETCSLSPIIIK